MFKKYKNQDLDMTFWWKKNPKSPQDYVKFISDQLGKLESSSTQDGKRKAQEEVSKYLMYTKHFILGDTDPRPTAESIDELYSAMYGAELFYDLLIHFGDLEFEARKEVTLIFSICLRYSKDNKLVTVDYLVSKPKTLYTMLRTVESAMQRKTANDIFLTVGSMLMECIKYEQLCRIILQDPQLWKLFDIVRFGNFDTSTESLQILSSALTTHTKLVSKEFFNHENNMNKFIQNINKLMAHGSYVTKRQSTKLLASLIVVRSNNQLMNTYINSLDNLKLIMVLMTDKSKNLQHEAFNVFKVMVANPRKSKPVFDILVKNREKLLKYFETFGLDYQEPTFIDEKEFIVQEIESLPRIVSSSNIDCNANVTTSPPRNVAAAQDMT
ncbi:hypothetical protein ZYGR_0AG05640 [Zygosaccharomyces rouxii]|uniref:Protein HYM1 n=1 Tax=Zygosaccharomyces rouxii TaxID=4956 RepID=A0A1Q3AAF7_ZYGRO|nr:hypothetical protein ZYGR_0AG05640 [Zygosaccharomyces rouxii]